MANWIDAMGENLVNAAKKANTAPSPEIPVKLFRFPGIDRLFVAREDYLKLESALRAAREERHRLDSHYLDAKELIQRMMKEADAECEARKQLQVELEMRKDRANEYRSWE